MFSFVVFTNNYLSTLLQEPGNANGAIIGYKVFYRVKGQLSNCTEKTLTGSVTSHTLTSLQNWTEYEITVKVYNSKGVSPASAIKSVRTSESGKQTQLFR